MEFLQGYIAESLGQQRQTSGEDQCDDHRLNTLDKTFEETVFGKVFQDGGDQQNDQKRKIKQGKKHYCIDCGKPARYCTQSWIEYLCEDCFNKIDKYSADADPAFNKYKKLCRLKEEDIPKVTRHYPDGKEEEIDLGIDFKKMWGLEEK